MEIKTIAVVGAADAGRAIAYTSAVAGYRTILEDISPAKLQQGVAWLAQRLVEDFALGKIDAAACDAALANIGTANSAEDASREADLIIETVPDEMEMRIEVFTIFDKFAKPGSIFASTTPSLSITELASITFCPERCIGLRFFLDVPRATRLELVKGRETSVDTIAACCEVGRRMGLEVFLLSEEQVLFAGDGD